MKDQCLSVLNNIFGSKVLRKKTTWSWWGLWGFVVNSDVQVMAEAVCTVECRYNAVRYCKILLKWLQELRQNINHMLDPQKTPHSSPVTYLALTGELWGVVYEYYWEIWPHYNDTSLSMWPDLRYQYACKCPGTLWCQTFSRHSAVASSTELEHQGAVSIRKTVLPGMAIPMLKIRRPNGRLIFNMEIAIRR